MQGYVYLLERAVLRAYLGEDALEDKWLASLFEDSPLVQVEGYPYLDGDEEVVAFLHPRGGAMLSLPAEVVHNTSQPAGPCPDILREGLKLLRESAQELEATGCVECQGESGLRWRFEEYDPRECEYEPEPEDDDDE